MPTKSELAERVAALEKALHAEQRFGATVLNATAALVIVMDKQGHIVRFNRACEEATGYTADEVKGETLWQRLILPEEREGVQSVFDELSAGMFPNQYENYWVTKDGGRVLIAWSNTAILDEAGDVAYVVGTGIDVGAHRQTEETLLRLKSLIDNTNDFVSTSDMEGNIFYTNPAGRRMVGYPKDVDLSTINIADHHSPEWAKKVSEAFLPVVMEEGVWSGELEVQHADGHPIPVSGVIMLVKDDKDNPIGFGAIYRDITEQKKAEQALQESQQLFQTFLDNFPAVVFAKDPEGHVILTNKVLADIYSMTKEEMLGKTIYDLMPGAEEMATQVWTGEKHVMETQQPTTEEQTVIESDGEHVKFSTIFPIINDRGESYAVGVIALDITERKQAEAERARLQQEVIEAQKQALKELSTPIIPVVEGIIVMPLVGSIDTSRARELTRALLGGVTEYRAKTVILDITGVPVVDSGVADHLNKTIQAARLKGASVIITGISDAVAETVVDLGIDWAGVETLRDLQTGLLTAVKRLNISLA